MLNMAQMDGELRRDIIKGDNTMIPEEMWYRRD